LNTPATIATHARKALPTKFPSQTTIQFLKTSLNDESPVI